MSKTPEIPESDRKLFDADAWLSAAIALDVMATRLGKIDDKTVDADQLVRELIEIGLLGGLDDNEVDTLLAAARGDVGDVRSEIAPLLTAPSNVQKATRLLRDGARALVREATLELEASALVNYKLV